MRKIFFPVAVAAFWYRIFQLDFSIDHSIRYPFSTSMKINKTVLCICNMRLFTIFFRNLIIIENKSHKRYEFIPFYTNESLNSCIKGKTQCIFLNDKNIFFQQIKISRCFKSITIFSQKINTDKMARKNIFSVASE